MGFNLRYPIITMQLFSVRTVYRVVQFANSQDEAYRKVYEMMKLEPGVFLAGVEVYQEPKKRSLLRRLFCGN